MSPTSPEDVFVRTRAGQAQVLRTDRATTLAQHLLMRFNGYSPLALLLTDEERPLATAALAELLAQGWIERAVPEDAHAPTESQWGLIDGLGLAA